MSTIALNDVSHVINATDSDLATSSFRDVRLAGSAFSEVTLADSSFSSVILDGSSFQGVSFVGVTIQDGQYEKMTIDGIEVSALLEAYQRGTAARAGVATTQAGS